MAFTFLAAQGRAVGASLLDASRLEECRTRPRDDGARRAADRRRRAVARRGVRPGATQGEVATFEGDLPEGWVGLDVGERTAAAFAKELAGAATILWNGPMGAFEDARFAHGTERRRPGDGRLARLQRRRRRRQRARAVGLGPREGRLVHLDGRRRHARAARARRPARRSRRCAPRRTRAGDGERAAPGRRGQLEAAPRPRRGHPRRRPARRAAAHDGRRGVDTVVLPPFTDLRTVSSVLDADGVDVAARRPARERARRRARSPARSPPRCSPASASRVVARRPLRAPAALLHGRRDGRAHRGGRAPRGASCRCSAWGRPRRSATAGRPRTCSPASSTPGSPRCPGSTPSTSSSPTSPCGRSARGARPPPRTPASPARTSARLADKRLDGGARRAAHPLRGLGRPAQRRRARGARRRRRRCSWAARASRPRRSLP